MGMMSDATRSPDFPLQHLARRAVVAVTGADALAFLQRLVTADVSHLAEGEAAHGALLTPQGKILHDFFMVRAGDGMLLDCAASQSEALLKRLSLYRLRSPVEIAARDDLAVGVSATKPAGLMAYADPRLAAAGYRVFAPAGSLPEAQGYEAARLALGLPDSDGDIGSGQVFPHEANMDQLHGVSFSKGCYVGQEVVSRMEHRGTAKSRMVPVRLAAAVPAERAITSGDTAMGELLSVDADAGLALLRLDRLAEATAPLMAGATRLHPHRPLWARFEMTIPEALA